MAPANNQPLLSDGKKLTIAALAVAGLFLLCYGTGESTVVIAGLGVLVGLGGPILIIVTTSRAAKRTYVFGTAHVHDVSGLPTAGNTGRIQMQLIINARGIDGVPVMVRDNSVPANKWPDVGATLPVRVLETNANKVTVLWDQVRTHAEVGRTGYAPPSPREDVDSAPADPPYAEQPYPESPYADHLDDDRHAVADEDDYDDGPLPPDDRPTRTDLPPIRADEPAGSGSPVAVMDRQQVVEISPTPGSSYPGYPYEEHASYSPSYPATPTSPPDESDLSPYDLTPQDLPTASASQAASATSAEAAPSRVSSRRRPSPYRRKPGNHPYTRPTASAPFRTGTGSGPPPDNPDDAALAADQDLRTEDDLLTEDAEADLLARDVAADPLTEDVAADPLTRDAVADQLTEDAVAGSLAADAEPEVLVGSAGAGQLAEDVEPDLPATDAGAGPHDRDAEAGPHAAALVDPGRAAAYAAEPDVDDPGAAFADRPAETRWAQTGIAIPPTADRETDWAPPARQDPAGPDTDPAPGSTARETAWIELGQPTPEPEWPDPAARATTFSEPTTPHTGPRDTGPRDTDWPDPTPAAPHDPADQPLNDSLATRDDAADLDDVGAANDVADRSYPATRDDVADRDDPVVPDDLVDGVPGGHEQPGVEPPRSAWNNGWARTVWPHPERPETAPEEPDFPDGLDSDAEALEGGVFDPSGYATDSPDDLAEHVETVDDSYAMPSAYGIPEGGADIYVPDPYVSESYDPEPDFLPPHEEINGHAVEIVAPPTEPYRPDTDRQPSPIDELFAPWPEPRQRPADQPADDQPADDQPARDHAVDDTQDPHYQDTVDPAAHDQAAHDQADPDPTAPDAFSGSPADTTDPDDELRPALDEVDPADALEPEPDPGQVARFLAASPKEAALPVANPAVHGISVTLQVSDLQRSRRFYRDKMGLQELDSSLSSAVLVSGDSRVLLRQVAHMTPVDRRTVHLHLEVPDVYEAYERLRADGVEFVHRPRVVPQGQQLDLCTATFRDPDGHAVEISRWELRR